ncbi:hypothetical protein [Azospirillum canadense]|uniref:hypothetical protein n=1 Tax=Azospirillum canadense TaxID=403962 RepID=UPI002225FE49|nr:hypothetical protein [Azospirillum canadense]MCW2239503.1 hypothetical protein [Azospirillum canadense]
MTVHRQEWEAHSAQTLARLQALSPLHLPAAIKEAEAKNDLSDDDKRKLLEYLCRLISNYRDIFEENGHVIAELRRELDSAKEEHGRLTTQLTVRIEDIRTEHFCEVAALRRRVDKAEAEASSNNAAANVFKIASDRFGAEAKRERAKCLALLHALCATAYANPPQARDALISGATPADAGRLAGSWFAPRALLRARWALAILSTALRPSPRKVAQRAFGGPVAEAPPAAKGQHPAR